MPKHSVFSRAFLGSLTSLIVAPGIVGSSGCASQPRPAVAPVLTPGYTELYSAGRYAEAQTAAAARAKELPNGPERERAMLVAGQSAHALSRDAEAEPWLKPLLESGNPEIAGRAGTLLGLIAQRASNNTTAIRYFQTASEKLAGDESARALMYMGDSYKWIGNADRARDAYIAAQGRAKVDSQLKAEIGTRLAERSATPGPLRGGFSVQVGAFSARQRAQGTVDRLRSKTAALGMGEPRVIDSFSGGKQVFLVHVGRYATHAEADRAKQQLGEPGFVTKAGD